MANDIRLTALPSFWYKWPMTNSEKTLFNFVGKMLASFGPNPENVLNNLDNPEKPGQATLVIREQVSTGELREVLRVFRLMQARAQVGRGGFFEQGVEMGVWAERGECEQAALLAADNLRYDNGDASRETYGALEAKAAIQCRSHEETEQIVAKAVRLQNFND